MRPMARVADESPRFGASGDGVLNVGVGMASTGTPAVGSAVSGDLRASFR
jgi:hypothetical protein